MQVKEMVTSRWLPSQSAALRRVELLEKKEIWMVPEQCGEVIGLAILPIRVRRKHGLRVP